MKKCATLGFVCLMLFSQAQIFNRSLSLTTTHDHTILTHRNGSLLYANSKFVQSFGANGNILSSIRIPDSLPQASLFHTGFFHRANGNVILYGYYVQGCDVVLDEGFYLHELNNTAWSKTKVQSMPLAGVHDLIAMDNNRLFLLTGSGYVVLNGSTFDTIRSNTFQFGMDVRQALYLGGDDVLIESRTWASAQPFQMQVNVATNNVLYTGLTGGYHFDVSDTLIGVFKQNHYRVVLYDRFAQNAVDSVDLHWPSARPYMDVQATENHLLIKSGPELYAYAFPTMDSAGAYTPYSTTALFIGEEEQLSTSKAGEIALVGSYLSHIGLESGSLGAPHADAVGPLSMRAENIAATVLSIDTNGYHATGTRGVRLEADWEVTLYNNSSVQLDSFRLMHVLPLDMLCGPRFGTTADTVYTLTPGDSVKVQVYKVPSGDMRISGTDLTNFFEVHAVMANGKQVEALTATGAVVIRNVGEEEFRTTDFALYPNPARDLVHIASALPWQKADILSLEGKAVRSFSASGVTGNTLNVSGLPEGVYLIRISAEAGQVIKKLMIK